MHVALVEMSTDEAAAHATKVFIDVSPYNRILSCARNYVLYWPMIRLLCRRSRGNAAFIRVQQITLHSPRYPTFWVVTQK